MSTQQQICVFGNLEDKYIYKMPVDEHALQKEILAFKKDSLNGVYYAPFDINWKNSTYIPEETNSWFEKLAELLTETATLSLQGDHKCAFDFFQLLFECIEHMESSGEVIFADEYGMWMLPIQDDVYINAYVESAAILLNTKAYAEETLAILKENGKQSHLSKIDERAQLIANEN